MDLDERIELGALFSFLSYFQLFKGIVSRDLWPPFFVIKLILLRL